MRQVMTNHWGDLASIYDDDVELVSVTRPESDALRAAANELLASAAEVQAQWMQPAGKGIDVAHGPWQTLGEELQAALGAEITAAVDILADLLGCTAAGIRIRTLRGPMCPRFHADRVPCRLLIAVAGSGTEWIPGDDVDPVLLADRASDAVPIKPGGAIGTLHTGSWSLLKGSEWSDRFRGVVHRSPEQNAARLLVSLDPIFTPVSQHRPGGSSSPSTHPE
jgi:hypothetical protein